MHSFILDDFTWSFSRIETFDRCGLCFDLQYIKCLESTVGCFGQYGSLIHTILEKYLLGELAEYELASEYKNNFSKVVTDYFPENKYVDLREKYYSQGLEYFSEFNGFEQEPIGVEEQYFFKIGNHNFTGLIDVETIDSIVDHKTKSAQHILKLTKKHNKEDYVQMLDNRYIHRDNFKQLYIYSIPYKEKHGHYPKYLSLNMAKIQDWYTIEFNEKHFEEEKNWVIEQIEKIYSTEEFLKGENVSQFWCNSICGQRFNCKHSDRYIGVDR